MRQINTAATRHPSKETQESPETSLFRDAGSGCARKALAFPDAFAHVAPFSLVDNVNPFEASALVAIETEAKQIVDIKLQSYSCSFYTALASYKADKTKGVLRSFQVQLDLPFRCPGPRLQ